MARLKEIWIQIEAGNDNPVIRVDWDNDRHQRIEINGSSPQEVARALKYGGKLINQEQAAGKI